MEEGHLQAHSQVRSGGAGSVQNGRLQRASRVIGGFKQNSIRFIFNQQESKHISTQQTIKQLHKNGGKKER